MKRAAIFITYFQSPFQYVHVYQVLHSEYFFAKFDGRFSLMPILFYFPPLFRENLCQDLAIL